MNDHAATWTRLINAVNARDWEGMTACLASDAVLHDATQGLGSTSVRFDGAQAIVDGHRAAADQMGLRWEIVATEEAEDLVTALVMNGFGNGKRGLAAAVVRFDAAGRVREVYSYNKRPS